MMLKLKKDEGITLLLIGIVVVLVVLNVKVFTGPAIGTVSNIYYEEHTKTLDLDSLTIKQKIAQMITLLE